MIRDFVGILVSSEHDQDKVEGAFITLIIGIHHGKRAENGLMNSTILSVCSSAHAHGISFMPSSFASHCINCLQTILSLLFHQEIVIFKIVLRCSSNKQLSDGVLGPTLGRSFGLCLGFRSAQ